MINCALDIHINEIITALYTDVCKVKDATKNAT